MTTRVHEIGYTYSSSNPFVSDNLPGWPSTKTFNVATQAARVELDRLGGDLFPHILYMWAGNDHLVEVLALGNLVQLALKSILRALIGFIWSIHKVIYWPSTIAHELLNTHYKLLKCYWVSALYLVYIGLSGTGVKKRGS